MAFLFSANGQNSCELKRGAILFFCDLNSTSSRLSSRLKPIGAYVKHYSICVVCKGKVCDMPSGPSGRRLKGLCHEILSDSAAYHLVLKYIETTEYRFHLQGKHKSSTRKLQ